MELQKYEEINIICEKEIKKIFNKFFIENINYKKKNIINDDYIVDQSNYILYFYQSIEKYNPLENVSENFLNLQEFLYYELSEKIGKQEWIKKSCTGKIQIEFDGNYNIVNIDDENNMINNNFQNFVTSLLKRSFESNCKISTTFVSFIHENSGHSIVLFIYFDKNFLYIVSYDSYQTFKNINFLTVLEKEILNNLYFQKLKRKLFISLKEITFGGTIGKEYLGYCTMKSLFFYIYFI